MSDSVSVTTETTGGQTDSVIGGDVSGTTLPLVMVSAYQDSQVRHQVNKLPNLPSHRFRYSVWHDLRGQTIKGYELKAPRVRDGPEEKEEFFYKVRDENEQKIHHSKKGKDRKDYRDKTECWEDAVSVNLSYQDLDHNYQHTTLLRVLKRLLRAKYINLQEDGLLHLNGVSFPVCEHLNLSRNYIKSFGGLPQMPNVKVLNLYKNDIRDLSGIGHFKSTTLKHLVLKDNPIAYTLNYRQKIFQHLPGLLTLDNLKRQPEDEQFHIDPEEELRKKSNSCVIS